ncbi:MAG: rhomboid family intramembrane serine protease [candidate division KSB1 bacterium]|nr:rhomboid family intramembrane serine protease [candidate division KSB1 bacterium]
MLNRKTTGSILCPSCGKLVSVNAKECIYCGRKYPGLWGFGPALQKLFGLGSVTSILIVVNVVLYIIALLLRPAALLQIRDIFSIFSPDITILYKLGMTGSFALSQGRWWTLITAAYLHGGLLHILFNMLWLRQLGTMVEGLYGSARTFLIFTAAGVVGFVFSNMAGIDFTLGSSGAVFGLLGALVYYGRRRGGFLGTLLYRQVGTWAIVLFAFGFLTPGVNNMAHAGGFLGGLLAALMMGFNEHKAETTAHRLAALAVVVLTIVCFGLAVAEWVR